MKKTAVIASMMCFSTALPKTDLELIIAKLDSRIDQLEIESKRSQKELEKLGHEIKELQHFQTWPQGFIQGFKNNGNNRYSAQIYFKIRMLNAASIEPYVEELRRLGKGRFEHVLIGTSINMPITISVLGDLTESELEDLVAQANKKEPK